MIYPNIDCYFLCLWMLNVSEQRLTGSQITVTQNIRDAALAQTGVTENEWNNFNLFAAWRNPYYIVYRDYRSSLQTDLNNGLLHYYDFEGNSNDQVGSINGTDSNIIYSNSYGKIGQGARNNTSTGNIILGSVSDFNFIHTTGIFAYNFWSLNTSTTATAFTIGNASSAGNRGFYTLCTGVSLLSNPCFNGGVGSGYLYQHSVTSPITDTNWHMITIAGDGAFMYFYIDSILRSKVTMQNKGVGNATNVLRLFSLLGTYANPSINIDELGIWDRNLNQAEIIELYNSGNGLAYPF